MSDLEFIVVSILASVAASGTLAGVLIYLSKEWMTTRLRAGIQHEYDQKLESLEATLNAENDATQIELRSSAERQATALEAAHSSFAEESQKASMRHKLQAVDRLWGHVLQLRKSLPPLLGPIDLMTVDEYKSVKAHPLFKAFSKDWSFEKIAKLVGNDLEEIRPYIGEYAWAVFFSYQAVLLKVAFLFYGERMGSETLTWQRDAGILRLVKAVLSAEEMQKFDGMTVGKITWLQRRFESKILDAARKVIAGQEPGAEEALAQAQTIQHLAAEVGKETTLPKGEDIKMISGQEPGAEARAQAQTIQHPAAEEGEETTLPKGKDFHDHRDVFANNI